MLNRFCVVLVLYSFFAPSLSAQAYSPDAELTNLLEMKTIVLRLSESLTLRESLLSAREQDWTVREKILQDFETDLSAKESDLTKRENLIQPIEQIYEDLNTSLTKQLKQNKVIKTALWIVIGAAVVEGIVIWLK